MYKPDLVLNNLLWLIYYKTKPTPKTFLFSSNNDLTIIFSHQNNILSKSISANVDIGNVLLLFL